MVLSLDQLIHIITIERYRGEVDGQAAFDPPRALTCYLETRRVLLDPQAADDLGVETGLEGRLFANDLDLPAGSRILDRGAGGYLGAVTRYDDGGHLSHSEVEVTPRPPAAARRTATVSLTDPAETTRDWDAENEVTREVPAAPYAAGLSATIEQVGDGTRADVADEIVRQAPYLVKLTQGQGVSTGHIVTVLDASDPLLIGRRLRVEHVVLGSTRLQRELFCSLDD